MHCRRISGSELGEYLGGESLFGRLVLLLAGIGTTYGEEQQVVFGENVKGGGGVAGGDEEGVLADAGDRSRMAADLLYLGARGLEVGTGPEGNVDAVLAPGVAQVQSLESWAYVWLAVASTGELRTALIWARGFRSG